jgi:hypothetical protein
VAGSQLVGSRTKNQTDGSIRLARLVTSSDLRQARTARLLPSSISSNRKALRYLWIASAASLSATGADVELRTQVDAR